MRRNELPTATAVHRDGQPDLLDQLCIRHSSGVLVQHSLDDRGLVGIEAVTEGGDDGVGVHHAA